MKIKGLMLGLIIGFGSAGSWSAEAVAPLEAWHPGAPGEPGAGTFTVTNVLTFNVDVSLEVTPLTGSGTADPLPAGEWIQLNDKAGFRLAVGESRTIAYRTTFPSNLSKPAVGAITLSIKNAENPTLPPVYRRELPIHFVPRGQEPSLKISLKLPAIHFVAATAAYQGPQKVEVSVMVANEGGDPVGPRGTVLFLKSGQTIESLPLSGSQVIPPGSSLAYSALSQTTKWVNGDYEARVSFDFGDAYGKPQRLEKIYFFSVSGSVISVKPGSAKPQTVTPR